MSTNEMDVRIAEIEHEKEKMVQEQKTERMRLFQNGLIWVAFCGGLGIIRLTIRRTESEQ